MKNDLKSKWNEIITRVRDDNNVTAIASRTFLEPLKFHSLENDVLTIIVDEKTQGNNTSLISNRYDLPIRIAVEELTGLKVTLNFVLSSKIDKEDSSFGSSEDESSLIGRYPFLNSGHSFDTFVVSSSNSMAHAACLSVAESPTSQTYNPLFIYGGSGLGKTHLMHSMARYIIEHFPELKVMYVTSETFTNEVIEAIRNNKVKGDSTATTNLKKKYRNVDVLLIDDIQFIIGKESTQEEFFHTFNTLYEEGKQIVITSDKPPREMDLLEERLRSRFVWGLPVDIQPPDYETSMAILRKRQEKESIQLNDKILSYIASNIKSNVRDLEGAFNRVILFSRLNHQQITLELAEKALKDMISPNDKIVITIDYIIDIVTEHFNITKEAICSNRRTNDIVQPRFICMYLCNQLTDNPLTVIGEKLGGRDHSTVINGIRKIEKQLVVDNSLQNTIDILKKKINP